MAGDTGQMIGSLVGTGVGAAVGAPTIGAAVGGGAGSIVDLFMNKKPSLPPAEDPEQRQFLNQLKRDVNSRFSGSYAAEAQDRLEGQQASITEGIKRSSGSGGELLKSMLSSTRNSAQGFNKVLANIEQTGIQREGLVAKMIGDMAQRKLELGMVDYLSQTAENEGNEKALMSNILAGAVSGKSEDLGSEADNIKDIFNKLFSKEGGNPTGDQMASDVFKDMGIFGSFMDYQFMR